MRRAPWPTVSEFVPPAAAGSCSVSLAALAAPGCGHQAKIEFANVDEAADRAGDPAAGPEHRPGGRPAELHRGVRAHVDLSQADRLHREVDRGHRRQGEEGRGARHAVRARAGRGPRDQGRDRRARPGADRAGQGGGGGGQGRRQGGRGAAQGGQGDPGQVRGPGRALGRRRSSGCSARSTRRGRRRILEESTNQLKSSIAARDFAKATIKRADAELLSKRAALAKAEVDVKVAEADLKVAESEERRLKAWVGYLTLTAPYDGVITARNANTFDFVLPATGDPSANYRSPRLSPGGVAAPIYVVDRTDIVRIFVDVPEQDANYIHVGTKATVLAKGYRDEPIPADGHAHLLGAEHEEPHAPRRDRPAQPRQPAPARDVRLRQGDHRAARRAGPAGVGADLRRATRPTAGPTRTGARCGPRSRRASATASGSRSPIAWSRRRTRRGRPWVPIDGKEQVIMGDQSLLADGEPVQIAPAADGTKLASEAPTRPRSRPVESALPPGPVGGVERPDRRGEDRAVSGRIRAGRRPGRRAGRRAARPGPTSGALESASDQSQDEEGPETPRRRKPS